ncbi:MAG: phosphopantetheine-binding protein [Oscillospiraceae bacterium]|nr:phosphopantetheine-binding protein [Oscillospiraceae bacterium]
MASSFKREPSGSSLSIISLVAEIEDEFDITIPAVDIIPANFNSAKAMMKMIERLQDED